MNASSHVLVARRIEGRALWAGQAVEEFGAFRPLPGEESEGILAAIERFSMEEALPTLGGVCARNPNRNQ